MQADSYLWSVTNKETNVTAENTTSQTVELSALSAGSFTLNVKVTKEGKSFTSKLQVKASALEIINGHTLPPIPDKTLNDSTLLGIDSNNNGVRDDVEIWIYHTYKDKHPVHIDIAMQYGGAYNKILENPQNALEIEKEVSASLYCNWYYKNDAKYFDEPILVYEDIDDKVIDLFFNTLNRENTYNEYDALLSGRMYSLPKTEEMKSFCDFNTTEYDK